MGNIVGKMRRDHEWVTGVINFNGEPLSTWVYCDVCRIAYTHTRRGTVCEGPI